MLNCNLLDFIKGNLDWFILLQNPPYNLSIKKENDYFLFSYHPFKSDFSIPLVKEARGIIIDTNKMKVVCYPFDKFFNIQENHAATIDWNTAKIQQKIDGSIIKLWHDSGEWHVSTNNCIFAQNAQIPNENQSNFLYLFQTAVEIAGLRIGSLPTYYTYIFELVSPYNRVVVPYSEIDLYHIGTRDNYTYEEIDCDIGVKKPQQYSFDSLEEIMQNVAQLPYDQEGYVVVDQDYNRVKIKAPAYVAAHKIKGNGLLSDENILERIQENNLDDFLAIFPEYSERCYNILEKYEILLILLKSHLDYVQHRQWADRKELACYVNKLKIPSSIFFVLDKKADAIEQALIMISKDKILNAL